MKHIWLLSLALLATGCERPSDTGSEATDPSTEDEAPQASIMRPDVVTPTEAPAPIEPLELTIGFPENGSEIPDQGVQKLEEMLTSMQVKEGGRIELGAHTDSAGSDEINLRASRARGEAVRNWLVERGIAEDRIALVAFGEQNPVRPNALPDGSPDEAGRAANRRVEIYVPVRAAPSAAARRPTLAEEIVDRTSDSPATDATEASTPQGD